MRLMFFILLITGALVQIYSLKLGEDNPDSIGNTRRKRELDVEDVINRFEMERESPLHDIFHLPPFEQDWNNALSTNYTIPRPSTDKPNNDSAEFKLELSKDEEHVVSQSGGRYRGNSAVNWWYSVESYSNVTHFNFTDSESEFGNGVENKQGAVRKPDEDHVVSRVPGLSIGRETTLDEVVIESPTTPRMSVTLPPEVKHPNVTTRYILLQSGRIVAINVTSVSSVFKATSGSGGNKPSLPPVYFGSRIRKTNNSVSHNVNDINKRPNAPSFPVKPAAINVPTRINTPSSPVRLQNLREADFVTTKSPSLIHSVILTTPSSIWTHASTEGFQVSRADVKTTRSPRTVPPPPNTAGITPRPTARIRVLTETPKLVEDWQASTKKPATTIPPKNLPVLLALPEVSTRSATDVTKITKATTKRIFETVPTTKPTLAGRLLQSPVPTTVRAVEIQHLPTRQPLVISTESASTTPILKTTKAKLDLSSKDKTTTSIPTASLYTLPPRNIIETIFEVFNPDTSEIPFLVVTFDSLKEQSPTSATSTEKSPTDISSRAGKERSLTGSRVEYEKVRSTKPSLLHYNFNPYQRTGATTIQDLTTTKAFTTRSRLRGLQNILSTLPMSSSTEQEFTESTDSITKPKHDFVRIGALISSTTPITVPSSSVIKPEVTSTRRPRYRGLQFVTTIPRTVSPPTFPPVTARPSSVTSSRKPRHQQGFHLRNSVGFQTIPPGSFTDRRSYSSSNIHLDDPSAGSEPPIGRMSMDEVLAFRFEPTRKNSATLESLQQPTTSVSGTKVTEPYTINWFRGTTKKVRSTTRKAQVSRIVTTATTRQPRQAGLVAVERTRVPTTPGRDRSVGERNLHRQRSRPVVEVEQNGSPNTTTAKPFRVYYFEPKRKRPRKDELESESPRDQGNRIAVEHVKTTTRKPPIRTWVIQPQRAPRVLNAVSGRSQPVTPLIAPPITTSPSNNQDRSRRGRARFLSSSTASPLVVPVTSPASHPPSKKPWYSPYIRHQPNVGTTTVLPPDRRVVTVTSSSVRPTRSPPAETFPLPPGDSFEEIFFQPVKIQRIN